MRLIIANRDSVAIGRRFCCGIRADHTVPAGPVFHHDVLSQALRKPLGNEARSQVSWATRRIGNDQPNGAGGKALRPG
jgi:hypothetical protein